ncbi:MAG: hypothetical protein ABII26_02275 [Pseudomonadota bacterium]
MKKNILMSMVLLCALAGNVFAAKDVEIRKKKLISKTPPFAMAIPTEFKLVYTDSLDVPKENSLTRIYLFIKEKNRQVEEMFLVQMADKTNPQAGPMSIPPLRPYAEKRMYRQDRMKKGDLEIDYLLQLMAWNPGAPSLQPIIKKGYTIPHRWALQGQFLFPYLGEHAVFIRYSKDTNAFGIQVSEEGEKWNKDALKGNELKVYETFQKSFMEMVRSIEIKSP